MPSCTVRFRSLCQAVARRIPSAIALLAFAVWVGCGTNPSDISVDVDSAQPATRIVATTGMVADIVSVVGGEHVIVDQLIGAGIDPHLHKPSRDDVRAIINADMVFYSGLKLEGRMGDTLDLYSQKKPTIAVTDQIDASALIHPQEEGGGHLDPHVWNDVSAWSQCVDVVEAALSQHDSQHADQFRANADQYQRLLAKLHQYGIDSLGTIPQSARILVTSHDAFNYFGRAYGLQVLGVQGISTESEAGIQRINELVDTLVDNDVQAVFVETSVPRRSIEALIEGAASRGRPIKIGGELFSDAMGDAGTYEGTYVGMLDHNITTVTRALGGQADAGGFQGKLQTSGQSAREENEP